MVGGARQDTRGACAAVDGRVASARIRPVVPCRAPQRRVGGSTLPSTAYPEPIDGVGRGLRAAHGIRQGALRCSFGLPGHSSSCNGEWRLLGIDRRPLGQRQRGAASVYQVIGPAADGGSGHLSGAGVIPPGRLPRDRCKADH